MQHAPTPQCALKFMAGSTVAIALGCYLKRILAHRPGLTFRLPEGVEMLTRDGCTESSAEEQLMDELADVMSKSFAGTPEVPPNMSFNWALGPRWADRRDTACRGMHMGYFLQWCTTEVVCRGTGAVLYIRDPSTGQIQACSTIDFSPVRTGPFNKLCDGLLWLQTAFRLGPPPCHSGGKLEDESILDRMAQMGARMNELQERHARGNCLYVCIMAVAPEAQGKGMCSRLLRAINNLANKEGAFCYLETDSERNRAVYQHFGYEILEDSTLGHDDELKVCAMVRPQSDVSSDY